jgi:hypothetical protein
MGTFHLLFVMLALVFGSAARAGARLGLLLLYFISIAGAPSLLTPFTAIIGASGSCTRMMAYAHLAPVADPHLGIIPGSRWLVIF